MGFLKDAVLKVLSIGGKVLMIMTAGIVAERVTDKFMSKKKTPDYVVEVDEEEPNEEENKESSVWSFNQQQ